MHRVVAYVTDLMDRSKIAGLGSVLFTTDPNDAAAGAWVVVDLGAHADLVRPIRQAAPSARVVAYGRHTEVAALRQALDDGADTAVPRSKFFADMAGVLAASTR